MNKFYYPVLLCLCLGTVKAQGVVEWKFYAKKVADKTYEIRLTAKVTEPWHIYSQSTPKGGPLPTAISFGKNPLLILQGKPKEEGDMEMYHDEIFDVDVYAYGDKVDFVQIIKLKAAAKTKLTGTVEFMACTKEQCLTPEKRPFSVALE